MTDADRQAAFLALLRQFARADRRREFAFSSGVVGAVPMDDTAALACAQKGATLSLLALCLLEKAVFVVAALLPARNVALMVRTLLRKALNDESGALQATSVISVGAHLADADPYFGAFLVASDEPFNYLKIAGGFTLHAKGWRFVETSLSYPALFGLAVQALLHPLLVLTRLVAGAAKIDGWRAKLLYVALGCRETHRGTAFQSLLTARALGAHVNSDAVRSVIFPMEGRNWEKRLLACLNARGARSTGYLHCALTPRHAGLLHRGFFTDSELPTVLRTPGPMALKAIAPVFPTVQVKSGYFIRGDRQKGAALPAQSEALLFALTGNVGESRRLLRAIASLSAADGRPVVRLNPHAASHGRLWRDARDLGLDIWDAGAAPPRLCFFRSSSVAIGYLRMGVVPVYLDLGEVFSNNSFDVEADRLFERVTLDDGFGAAVSALARKYRSARMADGPAQADYYLDQSYQGKALAGLNELS